MQRLLCVNNKPVNNSYNVPDVLAKITEGKTYEGYQKEADTPNGNIEMVWIIPSLGLTNAGYALERFIPCSNTPAEVIEEEETELVTAYPFYMTYTFEQLKEDVRKEAEALRVHATKEERRKLDYVNLYPAYGSYDVYGQMTGHCYSMRAAKLMYKCAKRFFKNDLLTTTSNYSSVEIIIENMVGEKVENLIKERTRVKSPHYSAIEAYTLLPEAKNANLIAYLRGETETLEL